MAAPDARSVLDHSFLQMRERLLSLAADLDRIARAPGGGDVLERDGRIAKLHQAAGELLRPDPGRAGRVQMIFSDLSPQPELGGIRGTESTPSGVSPPR